MKVKTIKNVYAIKARALHSATLHVEIVQILPTHAVDVYEIIKCIGLHFLHSFFLPRATSLVSLTLHPVSTFENIHFFEECI